MSLMLKNTILWDVMLCSAVTDVHFKELFNPSETFDVCPFALPTEKFHHVCSNIICSFSLNTSAKIYCALCSHLFNPFR
jgi:hypothetical protein